MAAAATATTRAGPEFCELYPNNPECFEGPIGRTAAGGGPRAWPSPSAGGVWVEAPGALPVQLTVADALGRVVVRRDLPGGTVARVSLAGEPAGIYAFAFAPEGERPTVVPIVIEE